MTELDLEQTGALWWLTVALVAALGLVVGSFLNVVAWRVPRGESISHPRSACPACGHPVRARDNVPVVSWLLLRGKCRDCGEPISARYPLIEAATSVLFVLVLWHFGLGIEFVAFAYLAALGVALTSIDLSVQRLPDVLVLPAYIVLLVLFGVACALSGDWWPLARAVIGGAALFSFYFVAALVYPGGMGFGDVKLAGVIGIALGWLGWGPLVVGAFSAFLLGGLAGIIIMAVTKSGRRTRIPFGPWMIAGAAVGVAYGDSVWDAYTGTWA
ncbi:A24 family peptidase [Demequina sp. NBRC 110053]|uniref:prepilin peptidase n=1 Tax=Demequina sp. NBRC 110053 TaxID=1570342 RepID=UPI000A05D706|nr:A24 family peptidase [Demequina sp. NBRC 110053]